MTKKTKENCKNSVKNIKNSRFSSQIWKILSFYFQDPIFHFQDPFLAFIGVLRPQIFHFPKLFFKTQFELLGPGHLDHI